MKNINQDSAKQNQPEKRFSTGAIQATVWKNDIQKEGEPVSFRTISLARRYKDKEGNWKSTATMRVNDLPKASLVLQKAYEFLVLKEDAEKGHTTQVEEEELVI